MIATINAGVDTLLRLSPAAQLSDKVIPKDECRVMLGVARAVHESRGSLARHEGAGMVGRIIVGSATGPGAEPFDYWIGKPETDGWRDVPAAARAAFPGIERILAERRVRVPELERG